MDMIQQMRRYRSWLVAACLIGLLGAELPAAPPVVGRILSIGKRRGKRPEGSRDRALEELAKNIDWLEHEIDRWGSIVAKAPDVWGEARLTKYRREVEEQLALEISEFDKDRVTGAQLVSDSAAVAAAVGVDAQPLSDPTQPVAAPDTDVNVFATGANDPSVTNGTPSVALNINPSTVAGLFGAADADESSKFSIGETLQLEQTEVLDQLKRYLDHLNELRRINEGDDMADAPGYSLNLVRIPVSILTGSKSRRGYGAEITVTLTPKIGPELLPVAFREMVINDLVDQISVPLTRFLNQNPVESRDLLKEFHAYEGSQERLSQIVAELRARPCPVDPKLVDDLAEYVPGRLHYFDDLFCFVGPSDPDPQLLAQDLAAVSNGLERITDTDELRSSLADLKTAISIEEASRNVVQLETVPGAGFAAGGKLRDALNAVKNLGIGELLPEGIQENAVAAPPEPGPSPEPFDGVRNLTRGTSVRLASYQQLGEFESDRGTMSASRELALGRQAAARLDQELDNRARLEQRTVDLRAMVDATQSIATQLAKFSTAIETVLLPTSSSRRSVLPFPPSQLQDNYGLHELAHVALDAFNAFHRDLINRQVVHVNDVQALLREELSAAYQLLSLESLRHIWDMQADGNRELYQLIRGRNVDAIALHREQFVSAIGEHTRHTSTASLAWTIYVESILLNERLVEEVRNAGSAHGVLRDYGWLPYFGPAPPDLARESFSEYVRLRWPVRVFTLDPVVTEQNIADVSSIYREMQMAVAVAYASGQVGASGAMQTLRQLQRDSATIDLNRTVVGFSHGEDTFGWRFYPRFQTPPVEGNATVFFRDLLVGGPTDQQLLRSKELEPGMRECVAIVLMPSFISEIEMDARGNWFKLSKPGHTANSMQETLEFSRAIRSMETLAHECVRCAHLYRDGEVTRLLRRVRQLDRELPLQTLRCMVPNENTLGGFEVFSSGTRELAPELLGWYGAPGYDRQRGASLFLAGDNFSVHETKLIVGNQPIDFTLLSRQIMQVTLPPNLSVISDERIGAMPPGDYEGYVEAVVTTPYGASGHLLVPVVKVSPAVEPKPEVVGGGFSCSMNVRQEEAVWISDIGNVDHDILTIQLPASWDGVKTVTVRLVPVLGQDVLPSAEKVDVVPWKRGVFSLHGTEASSFFQDELGAKLKGYLDKKLNEETLIRAGQARKSLPFSALCYVKVGEAEIPVGQIPMTVNLVNSTVADGEKADPEE